MTSAIPSPPTIRPGKMFQKSELASRREKMKSDRESKIIPTPISQREPTRSENFPATGAMRMIRTVIGRNDAPVCTAE